MKMEQKFGFNVCGEGGEYESAVFDCPLFKRKLELVKSGTVVLGNDYAPVSYLTLDEVRLVEKTSEELIQGLEILSKLK